MFLSSYSYRNTSGCLREQGLCFHNCFFEFSQTFTGHYIDSSRYMQFCVSIALKMYGFQHAHFLKTGVFSLYCMIYTLNVVKSKRESLTDIFGSNKVANILMSRITRQHSICKFKIGKVVLNFILLSVVAHSIDRAKNKTQGSSQISIFWFYFLSHYFVELVAMEIIAASNP